MSVSITTAAIIRFIENLEDRSLAFYKELAGRWPEQAEAFQAFAEQAAKNKTQVVRTYQETISDALEASYSFEGLDLDDYAVETTLAEGAGYEEALQMAIALEEKAVAFYQDVAERSRALLATIPGAFRRVAKKRKRRKADLESMLPG